VAFKTGGCTMQKYLNGSVIENVYSIFSIMCSKILLIWHQWDWTGSRLSDIADYRKLLIL